MQPMTRSTASVMPIPSSYEGKLDLKSMDLLTLVGRCVREREQYRRTHQHDTSFGFELFRRALAEGDQDAWNHVYVQFHGLVECWVRRSSAFSHSDESCESITLAAFARFARVVTPGRFISFPNLATLLRYLRRCAESVVLDGLRAQRPTDSLPDEALLEEVGLAQAPDDTSMERVERQEFWNAVMSLLHNEAERVVVLRSFVLGMRPGDIYQARPDLFASIADVYSVKRNVIVRLRRNLQIGDLLGE